MIKALFAGLTCIFVSGCYGERRNYSEDYQNQYFEETPEVTHSLMDVEELEGHTFVAHVNMTSNIVSKLSWELLDDNSENSKGIYAFEKNGETQFCFLGNIEAKKSVEPKIWANDLKYIESYFPDMALFRNSNTIKIVEFYLDGDSSGYFFDSNIIHTQVTPCIENIQ